MRVSFESKGDFKNVLKWLDRSSKRNPSAAARGIADQGISSLSRGTPRDTGETASGWIAEVTTRRNITEIAWKNIAHPGAGVNVAKIIELGHGTGTGGYVPPSPYIKDSMTPVWKTAGDKVVKELIK